MKLRVSEIFQSIQGETSYVGLPCFFVRLSGCNLKCKYCDTLYARNGGQHISLDEILKSVENSGGDLVCITGGEPLLQPGTATLAEKLISMGKEVLVETNGSKDISKLPEAAKRIVDIKTPGSGEEGSFLPTNLNLLRRDDEVKFVITSEGDSRWARECIETYRLDELANISFSPAHGLIDPKDLAKWILMHDLPVRLNLQIHKYIYGPETKGV